MCVMKICVLQPDYSGTSLDYGNYDPPRNLAPLLEGHQVNHVFLRKISTYAQLKSLAKENYDVFVNLCEGYLEWDIPSIDVVHSLELLGLPYTGPTLALYDPPKVVMKRMAEKVGCATPYFYVVGDVSELPAMRESLRYPLFVKPAKAGDSLGVDDGSKVGDFSALEQRVAYINREFGDALVESYIDGKEFTVLVAAEPERPGMCRAFKPVEYRFADGAGFKTYALKTAKSHAQRNAPCEDAEIEAALREHAENIFRAFDGQGYARMDFRMDASRTLYFLEANFGCSIFHEGDYEGSADHILKYDGIGQSGFLKHIIAEGISRHKRREPIYSF